MSTFTHIPHQGRTHQAGVEFTVINCAECKGVFALMDQHIKRLRDSKETFYCPSGHANVYRESTEEKLRKELAAKESQIWQAKRAKELAEADAELAKKREELAAGETRRLMTRITSGICPCCNRFFQNVARHMQTKHPGAVKEHKPFVMTDDERRMMARYSNGGEAKEVRRRFVKAHAALSDYEIARLMIDGKLYASPHVPTVAKAVANIRKSL